MRSILNRAAVITLSVAAATSGALAQGDAGSKCAPQFNESIPLAQAGQALQRATDAFNQKKDATKDLKESINWLTDTTLEKGPKRADPIARAYVLGQAYIILAQTPALNKPVPRSEVGIKINPTETIDLLAAADSQFAVVEKALPECVAYFRAFRRLSSWANMVNDGNKAANAGKFDSAEYYAKRALLIEHETPYAYEILATASVGRNNLAAANDYYQKALANASKDTTYKDVQLRVSYQLALNSTSLAVAASGAEQKSLVTAALKQWDIFLPTATGDAYVASAHRNMVTLYAMVNDTAAAMKLFGPLVADPSSAGPKTLIHAGLALLQSFNKPQEAAKVLTGALAKDPYSHDALLLALVAYIQTSNGDAAQPLVARFLELEPNNPEGYQMGSAVYSLLQQKAGNAKDTKTAKMYSDSTVAYEAKSKMPVQVVGSGFQVNQNDVSITVEVTNSGSAPKDFDVTVEFIDQAGKTVASKQVSLKQVGAGNSDRASVSASGAGIVSFRFKPLAGI
jgi:tetratricopeptide (TPR) repeat protein